MKWIPAKPIADLFRSFSSVTLKLSQIIMYFAPIGVFALMTWVSGEFGLKVLLPLLKLVLAMYLGCLCFWLVFYGPTLLILRINPVLFLKRIRNPLLLAYSTASSTAILPTTLRCAEDQLGLSKKIAGFLLPLGTTMNLNGLSIYLATAVIFSANMCGIELSFIQYFTVVTTILFTAMGAGGVPGSTLVVMGAVLNSVGLPLTAVSLIAGVDRINDMAGTTTNVLGDLFAATIVARSENELEEKLLPLISFVNET